MSRSSGWRRFRRVWRSDSPREIDDELSFHLEMKRQDLLAKGHSPSQVERAVREAFGNRQRVEGELREIGRRRQQRARREMVLDSIRTDLLHAWRSFRRRPGVPLIVVLTLAAGIGASTVVFSLLDAVLLNPLAVHRSNELVALYEGESRRGLSYPMLQHMREGSTQGDGVAGSLTLSAALRAGDDAEQLRVEAVTGNYFGVLAVTPAAGRLLQAADEAAPGSTPHAVLSDGVWRRMFGADASVVGTIVRLNEQPFEVVGIAPPRFRGTSLALPVDVWIPVTMVGTVSRSGLLADAQVLSSWQFTVFDAVARVPRGMSESLVLAELAAVHAAAVAQRPPASGFQMGPTEPAVLTHAPLNQAAAARSREELVRFLLLLAAVVGTALAIACINVANLMLLRSRERHAEMSVRAALGASRTRTLRQLLMESMMLALAAGALGVAVALLSMRLLTAFGLPGGIALEELSLPLDLRVLGFTALASMLCAVAFGLAPAIAGSRADVMDAMRGSADRPTPRGLHVGGALIALQVALSLPLLVTGSLFVRSLQEALRVDLGFRSEGVAALSVGLRQHGYDAEGADAFIESVLAQAAGRPGVARVAAASLAPLEGSARAMPVSAEAPAPGQMGDGERRALLQVTPGYLELLAIPLLRGRDIEWTDRAGTPSVALVTETMAHELWPGEDPLGRPLYVMFGEQFTVVGVIADAHFTGLDEREPHIMLALLQTKNIGGMDRLRLMAQASTPAAALAALRSAVQTTDRRLPTFGERSIEQQVRQVLMPQRFGSTLLTLLGGVALMIAAVGIYAVCAYNVARRQRELGIRCALGAGRRELVRAVLGRTWTAIAIGIVAGLAVTAYATAGVRSLLFGISPSEPFSYAAASLMLVLVGLLASWLPARRAAQADPLRVIREQ
jgi:predicted permease